MLAPVLIKYLNHKIRLAGFSSWYHSMELRASLQWAYSMQSLLKFKKDYITDRELAVMVKQNEIHLKKILPCPLNKSFSSSEKALNEIINQAVEILQPKQK